MNQGEIKHTQRRIGVDDDGDWGRLSTEGAKRHLIKIAGSARNRFPTQKAVRAGRSVYGRRGSYEWETPDYSPPGKKIRLPFVIYYEGKPVSWLEPHEACADAFLGSFQRLAQAFPTMEERRAAGILTYDGLYNARPIRGGSVPSMHSYRCAIDLDAGRNGNASHWPIRSKMPIEVFECFAAEGILSAGVFWSRDGMHNQATSF